MRLTLLAAVAAGLSLAAPTRAADLEKYLPEDAALYVHITSKNLLTSEVVRKAIPMAFDKYGDQLLPFLALAKQFNPAAPDVPEEKFKEALAELKKPETIAKGFDAAKDFAPEFVFSGNPDGSPESFLMLIKAAEIITPELVEGFAPLLNQTGQIKVKKTGTGKKAVFELTVTQPQEQTFFAAVPEAGVICFAMSKKGVEGALAASGKSGGTLDATLKSMIAKRDPKEFVFVAGVKGKGDARETMLASLVLDKDISGKIDATFATAEEAKTKAGEMNEHVAKMVENIKGLLGDGANDIKAQLDGMKAKADGKRVTFAGKIPGGAVEKLLAK